jgi:hypothetical protein
VTIDHNTFDIDGTTILYAYGGTDTAPRRIINFVFTNNNAPHRDYGINGASASTGTLTFQMYFPSAVVTGNWLSGVNPAKVSGGQPLRSALRSRSHHSEWLRILSEPTSAAMQLRHEARTGLGSGLSC